MKKNIKSNLIALALASSCMLSLGSTSDVLASERLIKVQIGSDKAYTDGVESTIDAVPFQDSNWNTMVPVRFIATALGIDDDNITYKWETKEVTIVNGNETLKFKVGDNYLTKTLANGSTETYTMLNNAVAEIIDGRTFVPLRTIGEIFGVEVDWEQNTKTVTLIDKIESEVNAGITKTNLNNNVSTGSSYYSIRSNVINNYIYKENNNFITITANSSDQKVTITTYDLNFNKTTEKTLDFELSLFGGFYTNGTNNYIVYGQLNSDENDNQEVYRVVKYDTSFNRISSISIDGATSLTNTPFRSGGLSISENNGELTVHTSKLRYVSESDGLNHQSQMTFVIDTDTMEITNSTDNFQKNHVSHSFNQFVKYDGDDHVLVDHGDSYPRSVVIHKSKEPSNDFYSWGSDGYEEVNLLTIPGKGGANATGVSVGGLEVSDTNYLVPINKVDFDKVTEFNSFSLVGLDKDERDVVLLTCDKNLENVENITLQTYVGTDKTSSTPKIVDIDNNVYVVIWEEQNYQTREALSIKYVIVDGTGNPISNVQTVTGAKLSDVQPIYDGNNSIVWFTNNNAYSLNLTEYTIPIPTQTTTQFTTETTTEATTEMTTEFVTETTTQSSNSTVVKDASTHEAEFIELVNNARISSGVDALEVNQPVMDIARNVAQTSGIDARNLLIDGIRNYAENITYLYGTGEQSSAQEMYDYFNKTYTDRVRLLNAKYNYIGVGFHNNDWFVALSDTNENSYLTTTPDSNSNSSNSTVTKDASTHEAEFIELVNNAVSSYGHEPFKVVTSVTTEARAKAKDSNHPINIVQLLPNVSVSTSVGSVYKNKATAEELFNSFSSDTWEKYYPISYDYILVGFDNNNWYVSFISERNSSNQNTTQATTSRVTTEATTQATTARVTTEATTQATTSRVTTEATTQATTQQTTTQTTTIDARAFEEEVVRLVNIERAKEGLAPLEIFETAMDLARAKSQDMVDRNYFAHADSSGYYMCNELLNYSYTAAENIAAGQRTPEQAVASWMASTAGHRENILSTRFTNIGVGFVDYKWTQMFCGDLK